MHGPNISSCIIYFEPTIKIFFMWHLWVVFNNFCQYEQCLKLTNLVEQYSKINNFKKIFYSEKRVLLFYHHWILVCWLKFSPGMDNGLKLVNRVEKHLRGVFSKKRFWRPNGGLLMEFYILVQIFLHMAIIVGRWRKC